MNTIELIIASTDISVKEALIAQLSELGFDGFEESEIELKAYIPETSFDEMAVTELLNTYQLNVTKNSIPQQNWNAFWESNFEPLLVTDRLTNLPWISVRANFHPPVAEVAFDLEITPKMSFGTGHHATTYTVMQLMKDIDFRDKSVFDFGTGTGILAILAKKMGAAKVVAVDNDDWCIENAIENTQMNDCASIEVVKVSTAEQLQQFDVVIANINKNIILDNLHFLALNSKNGGDVILSGLLKEDEADILSAVKAIGWNHTITINKGMWIAMAFKS